MRKIMVKRGPDGNSGPTGSGNTLDRATVGIWADYTVPTHGRDKE